MGKEDKTHLNVVVIGHVDSGKSTTVSQTPIAICLSRVVEPRLASWAGGFISHFMLTIIYRPVT